MEGLFAALGTLAGEQPIIFLVVVLIGAMVATPFVRKWMRENAANDDEGKAIREAGEAIREELKGMLDKEQVRVEGLASALDAARLDVSRMHAENIELRADMSRLRTEMRSLFRTARAMRMAMQRAITDNDVLPLKIWLDLNPDDEGDPK